MRRLLRLAVIAAADAAAKFALEKKGQKVLNVKLYETGYTFTSSSARATPSAPSSHFNPRVPVFNYILGNRPSGGAGRRGLAPGRPWTARRPRGTRECCRGLKR